MAQNLRPNRIGFGQQGQTRLEGESVRFLLHCFSVHTRAFRPVLIHSTLRSGVTLLQQQSLFQPLFHSRAGRCVAEERPERDAVPTVEGGQQHAADRRDCLVPALQDRRCKTLLHLYAAMRQRLLLRGIHKQPRLAACSAPERRWLAVDHTSPADVPSRFQQAEQERGERLHAGAFRRSEAGGGRRDGGAAVPIWQTTVAGRRAASGAPPLRFPSLARDAALH